MKSFWSMKKNARGVAHTPLTIRVPILVTKPLTFSDRSDDRARVEPGSFGASKATHSCSPLFRDVRFSCSRFRSHWSSQAYVKHQYSTSSKRFSCFQCTSEFSSSMISCLGEIGGQIAVDIMVLLPFEIPDTQWGSWKSLSVGLQLETFGTTGITATKGFHAYTIAVVAIGKNPGKALWYCGGESVDFVTHVTLIRRYYE